MSDELSKRNFADDLAEVQQTEDAKRWTIEQPVPLGVWVRMASCQKATEPFQVQLLWNQYPEGSPSMKFRDPETGRLDLPTAWPQVRGFRPKTLDACVNWCSEGFAIHPEWQNDTKFRWDPRGNVLLKVLRILQSELDEYFSGRFPG
jgi:hypothetical protein